MRRRDFIKVVGSVALWPHVAHAQQPAMPVMGFLSSRSPDESKHLLAAFHKGLSKAGFVEGTNIAVEYRWAFGEYEKLPALATDLVRRNVMVIAAVGGDVSGRAAEQVLYDPNFPPAVDQLVALEKAAKTIALRLDVLKAGNDADLNAGLELLRNHRVSALLLTAAPYFDTRRGRIIEFTAANKIPAIYQFREYAVDGGLISYGPRITDSYQQAGVYVGRILKGAKPGDLPVFQPTNFEFVINLKTAKALGLTIPPGLISFADEVIE
jgi:putative tryptophan/tyrosine transport system substrate-binding protein